MLENDYVTVLNQV